MKKDRWFARMAGLLAFCAVLNTTATYAVEVGSDRDPLVTLSYLNETFLGEVLEAVDAKIQDRNRQIAQELGTQLGGGGSAVDTFSVVTLTQGQILYGGIGCEVMLRVGSAACVAASAPGLIDETAAATLNHGGALVPNHMYMMTIEGRGVQATAETVKVLVRGVYTIA